MKATSTTPLTLYIKYEDSGTSNESLAFSIGENVTSLNADNTTAKNPDLTTNQTTELTASLLTTGTVNSSCAKSHIKQIRPCRSISGRN